MTPRRVLFVVLCEKGHVNPFVGPAQALARRGHHVAFYAPVDLRGPLGRAGFTHVHGGHVTIDAGNRGAGFAALVADPARLAAWIRAMLVDAVPREVDRLSAVVAAERPDVIVADPMAYAAPIVAARARLPWAGVSTSLNALVPDAWTSALIETTRGLPRESLFARFGVEGARFRVSDCLSPWLDVAFTTRALVPHAPAAVRLAGASLPLGPRGDEVAEVALAGARPVVFMSLGSQISHQPRMFEVAIEASRGARWRLVLAAGDLAGTLDAPADVVQLAYAPQLAILRGASVMITHGGANSVMEALAHGVPLLVSPLCNDQPHNARFVREAGAGLELDLRMATPSRVRAALDALASDGPHRAVAARVGRSYAEAGGAEAVAAAVEDLVA